MTFDDPLLIVLIVIGVALVFYAAAAIKIADITESEGQRQSAINRAEGDRSH